MKKIRLDVFVTVLLGLAAAGISMVYRPYVVCGELMCSTAYYPVPSVPPASGDGPEFNGPLYTYQFLLIAWVVVMAISLLRVESQPRATSEGAALLSWSQRRTRRAVPFARRLLARTAVAAAGTVLLGLFSLAFQGFAGIPALCWTLLAGFILLILGLVRLSTHWCRDVVRTVSLDGTERRRVAPKREFLAYVVSKGTHQAFGVLMLGLVGLCLLCTPMLLGALGSAFTSPPEMLVVVISLVGITLGALWVGLRSIQRAAELPPLAPLTRRTAADLPAEGSLVRAAAQPPSSPETTLVRAAMDAGEARSEELLRPTEE
jgi:hypothetical protein